jgi:hypothetical protein
MTRDHTGRAEPVGHGGDLCAMNAELLRTAGELVESLTFGVARARLLVQENHRLRQECRAITTAPYPTAVPHPGPS